MLSKINENVLVFGFIGLLINWYPFGKQWFKIESSKEIVDFSKYGKDEIIFGLISSLYFSFIVSSSSVKNHLFL